MQPKINKTCSTTYKTIYENKETVQLKILCLHNLDFLLEHLETEKQKNYRHI